MRASRRLLTAAVLSFLLVCTSGSALSVQPAIAQGTAGGSALIDKSGTPGSVPGTTYSLTPKTRSSGATGLLGDAARVMLGLAGTVALAMFVWGGITWMTSGGDPKKVEAGKRIMVWTAVGLAVMFGAEAIIRAVLSALSSGTAT